jgi:hypothetical protein
MRCEKVRCMNSLDVCLDGVLWLCWDHYVEEMRRRNHAIAEEGLDRPAGRG